MIKHKTVIFNIICIYLFSLTVAAKPILLDHFTNETLQPGPNLQLSCTAAGNPVPEVTWYRDDTTLPPMARYAYNDVINADGDVVSHLNITRLRTLDGGLYRCEATSELGISRHEDNIFVIGLYFNKI